MSSTKETEGDVLLELYVPQKKHGTRDPQLYIQDEKMTVFEIILETPKNSSRIKECICNGAKLFEANENGKFPIHYAALSKCSENLRTFIEGGGRYKINLKEDKTKCNALHLLLDKFSKNTSEDDLKNILKCAAILIEAGCKIDYEDKRKRTPLNILNEIKKLTTNDSIKAKISEIIELCKEKISDKQIDSDCLIDMIKRNDSNIIESYKEYKQNLNSKVRSSQVYDCKQSTFQFNELEDCHATMLNFATSYNRMHIVKFLVDEEKIDINKTPIVSIRNQRNFQAAYVACSRGHHEILKFFVEKTIDGDANHHALEIKLYKDLVHELCSCFGHATDRTIAENYLKCFNLLVSCEQQFDVNCEDEYGCTPLYYASRCNIDEATKWLLKNTYSAAKNHSYETEFENVKKDIFREVLDECVDLETNQRSGDYIIDFSFLVPDNNKKTAILKEIKRNKNLSELLMHPVLRCFSHIGWVQLEHLICLRLFFFSLFMISFFLYVAFWKNDCLFVVSIILILFLFSKELVQMSLSPRIYCKGYVNWFEIVHLAIVLLAVCFHKFAEFWYTTRVLKCIGVLLTAFELMIILGDLPRFSISTYMFMLKKVTMTFIKAILIYASLMIGFALCFFLMFSSSTANNSTLLTNSTTNSTSSSVDSFDLGLMKTVLMFFGNLDALSLRLADFFDMFVFVSFAVIVSIVLMNLINGLALNDVIKIKQDGILHDLCRKVQVLHKYEILCLKIQSNCFLRCIACIFPHLIFAKKISIDKNGYARSRAKNNTENQEETDISKVILKLNKEILNKLREVIEDKHANLFDDVKKNKNNRNGRYSLEKL